MRPDASSRERLRRAEAIVALPTVRLAETVLAPARPTPRANPAVTVSLPAPARLTPRVNRAVTVSAAAGGQAPTASVAPAPSVPVDAKFEGHYRDWRRRRVAAIVEHYGAEFFRGASVLELGCGHGDIGVMFSVLGADVTFAEGRAEHVEEMRARYPSLPAAKFVRHDAEQAWPFRERFDVVLNLGLLYHVQAWERCLADSLRAADHVVLETEVCDSEDPTMVLRFPEDGYDQALSGTGTRPSAAAVERVMREEGFRFRRLADSRCNADMHRYDWPVSGDGHSENGLRRFWFCWRPKG